MVYPAPRVSLVLGIDSFDARPSVASAAGSGVNVPDGDVSAPSSGARDAPGSQRAWVEALFSRYRGALQSYLTRLVPADDASELVQETYFRLLRHGQTVQIEGMARALLFHTATNLARDLVRRRRARRADQHVSFDDALLTQHEQGPEEQVFGEQVLVTIERTLAAMPDDTRSVFLLCRFRELDYAAIAVQLGLSKRTVARKMADATERLGAALRAVL